VPEATGRFNGSIARFHFPPPPAAAYNLDVALHDLVDLSRYPIDEPLSVGYRSLCAPIRAELDERGCSVIRGFFHPGGAGRARDQARGLAPLANRNDIVTNAYSTADDPSLDAGHPIRLFMDRSNAFVPRESIPAASLIRELYEAPAFQRFVADCVGLARVHEYADPFAGLVLNVLRPGAQHPWHFDTNEFIASALLDPAESGGRFEYCPNIRSAGDERYAEVGRVIRGEDRGPVRRLDLRVGDLQLFRGRYSLHRVTRVGDDRSRISAIFAYTERPGVIGRLERTRQLFGRVSSAHRAAEAARIERADGLLD
jgi:hypothetical protein